MARKLGKGLEALIKVYGGEGKERFLNDGIPITQIIPNKNQPRQVFDKNDMKQLADSIKKRGIYR